MAPTVCGSYERTLTLFFFNRRKKNGGEVMLYIISVILVSLLLSSPAIYLMIRDWNGYKGSRVDRDTYESIQRCNRMIDYLQNKNV